MRNLEQGHISWKLLLLGSPRKGQGSLAFILRRPQEGKCLSLAAAPLIQILWQELPLPTTPGVRAPWIDSGQSWRPQLDITLSSDSFILRGSTLPTGGGSSSHFGGQERKIQVPLPSSQAWHSTWQVLIQQAA